MISQPVSAGSSTPPLEEVEHARVPGLPAVGALGEADLLCMGLGFVFTLALSLVLGWGRIFWEDEMLGWMLLTDPSWHHMVHAWKMGADGGGFSFYVLGRAWLRLFGPSEIAFRAFSATGFGLAFVFTWAALRRFYGFWIVAFALCNTYFCDQPLVLHMAEGRFYGLTVFAVALTVWLALRAAVPGRTPAWLYLATVLAHALLVTSHILGVSYSFFVLLAMVMLDLLARRLRPLLYLSAAATWLLLLPERAAIQASAQVGKPWFWTTQPTPVHLVGPMTGFSAEIAIAMSLMVVAIWWSSRRGGETWKQKLAYGWQRRRPIYVLSASFLLLSLAFLLEGYLGPVLFVSRYLMPTVVLAALLNAEFLEWIDWRALLPNRVREDARALRRVRSWAVAALVLAILLWDGLRLPPLLIAQRDYTQQLTAMLPKGVPVLVEDGLAFTEIIGRQHDSGVDYLFPMDWTQSTSLVAPRLEVTQYNLMKNWRKVGYFSGSIVDLPQFLATHASFLLVDPQYAANSIVGNPLQARFAATPGYTVRPYASLRRKGAPALTVYVVRHDPAHTGMPAVRTIGEDGDTP